MLVLYLSRGYLLSMGAWIALLVALFSGLLRYRQRCRQRSRRMVWANAGLSAAVALAFVTACELGFACFADFSDTFSVSNVSKRWLRLHIDDEQNNAGYRDREPFKTYIGAGRQRIVFFGDSFTVGHGIKRIEDRFSDRVAAWLEQKRPVHFVVANHALPGYEASLVEGSIRALFLSHSDVHLVIYVYNLNDIEGYDPGIQPLLGQVYTSEPRFPVFRDTYFLNWLYFRFVQFRYSKGTDYYARLAESYRSPAWEGLREKLSQIHRDCVEGHADFRMVLFPFVQKIGPDDPFREARGKIAEFCKSEKIPLLDLEPVFQKHTGENLVVSRFDAHPNERAHAIAALAIEEKLLSDLVSPAETPPGSR